MAKKDQTQEPAAPAQELRRWRVKHPAIGAFIREAATADEAKEIVLRERYPGDCQNPDWLKAAKLTMRVAELPPKAEPVPA